MIFVTVGGSTPFDRLIAAVDAWAGERGDGRELFAQIGEGVREPVHMPWTRFVSPQDFRARAAAADVIVAHAGMGTILTALDVGVPILVLPRRAALQETRNDHQLATAERLGARGLVHVAEDEQALRARLEALDVLTASPPPSDAPLAALRAAVRRFIEEG